MTEDEAKTKWCPFARQGIGTDGIGINRLHHDTNPTFARCIASVCMAWRWDRITHEKTCNVLVGNHPFGANVCNCTVTHHGYCGLAGTP